jgi:hypothetical protein
MQSFLFSKAISSSSRIPDPDPAPPTPTSSDNTEPASIAGRRFREAQKQNLSTTELIGLEKETYRNMLNGYFDSTQGYRIVDKGPVEQPLLTKSGKMVPGEYTAVTIIERRAKGTKVPHCVHVYSHPFEDLEIPDLMRMLSGVVDGLRGEGRLSGQEGIFGIVMLGQQISFFQVNR